MTDHPDDSSPSAIAARLVWEGSGAQAPTGADLTRAAAAYDRALALGRNIPRQSDKLTAPLLGPRTDIDA